MPTNFTSRNMRYSELMKITIWHKRERVYCRRGDGKGGKQGTSEDVTEGGQGQKIERDKVLHKWNRGVWNEEQKWPGWKRTTFLFTKNMKGTKLLLTQWGLRLFCSSLLASPVSYNPWQCGSNNSTLCHTIDVRLEIQPPLIKWFSLTPLSCWRTLR